MFAYSQMSQKRFRFNHFFGMTFVVEENIAPDPLRVVFLGAVRFGLRHGLGWHRMPNNRFWDLYMIFTH